MFFHASGLPACDVNVDDDDDDLPRDLSLVDERVTARACRALVLAYIEHLVRMVVVAVVTLLTCVSSIVIIFFLSFFFH